MKDNQSALRKLDLNKIFKTALQNGGEFAELFFEHSDSSRIFFENNRLDRITSGIDTGIGLRLIFRGSGTDVSGAQSAYGYTTDISEKSLLELAETMSKVAAGKVPNVVIAKENVSPGLKYSVEKDPGLLGLEEKVKYVESGNQFAWKASSDIKQVTIGYVETKRKIEIVNSLGVFASDDKRYLTYYAQLVGTRNGESQTAYEAKGGFAGLELFDTDSPESIVQEAARRLEVLLSAKKAPSGSIPVVLAAEAGGTMVHEAVGHGLEADLACNGLSVYQHKIGQQVANESVTIVDDGTMPGKRGSYGVDDEGTASKKNVLIENGILKAYMVDQLSHQKFGLELTGNGRRESYRHKPIVRMTNTYLAPGKENPEKILSSTAKGLYVKALGGGQVNTVTGDFVFAVTEGYLIYDGELGPAVTGATLTGNGPQVLKQVDRIGNDLGFAIGTCGKDGQGAPVTDAQPTIRIPEMTVGGQVAANLYWK